MRYARLIRFATVTAVVLAALAAAGVASASTITREITSGGTFAVPNAPAPVAGALGTLELRPGTLDADPLPQGATVPRGRTKVDHHGRHGGHGGAQNPRLGASFDGLNFFDQRFANGGNQFSVEPPDQGLCIGNGKVVEIVNSVYQVFDEHGHALTNPIDINTLFGYPAAIDRTLGVIGPDVFDPSCLYDQQTNTFFVLASTLDSLGDGTLTGTSHVDILVGSDPTKAYTRYSIDTTNDAQCTLDGVNPGPCFPDYPHMGADANGIYITTNVFDFFGPFFDGVNIYALPKAALASTPATVTATLVGTNGAGPSDDGGQFFTAIPAVSPGADQFATAGNGTEYFVSSRAIFTNEGTSSSLNVIRLSNTKSLATTPNLQLSSSTVGVDEYGVPAPPTQKKGQTPLADCEGSDMKIPAFKIPCWQAVDPTFGFGAKTKLQENVLDGNDSRVGGVSYAAGKLWADLGSAATDSHNNPVDGVAWFVVDPGASQPHLLNQGMLVKDGTNLTYPSLAATSKGSAAMGFTIVGQPDFPSAGYAGLDARHGTGDVQYAAPGVGPQDGFTEYQPFFSDGSPRPRWGDYGAAVADGNSIWVASEYIGQSCNLRDYVKPSPSNASAFGTCGDTRGVLGNWDTRISQLNP